MSSRIRKFESGAEKRKKKQRLLAAAQSQKGALDRFIVKESQNNSESQTAAPDGNVDDGHNDEDVEVEADAAEIDEVDDGNVADDDNIDGENKDIDGQELFGELIFVQDLLKESMGPLEILKFLKKRPIYHITMIAYRILLTILVTVASAERSFSKLKLLKSYLRSTMTQERLNGLTTIALESDALENINYEDIIGDFISRNTRRMMLFSRA